MSPLSLILLPVVIFAFVQAQGYYGGGDYIFIYLYLCERHVLTMVNASDGL